MIWSPLTASMFLTAIVGIPLSAYATLHAWGIARSSRGAGFEEAYALEKRYYLLSTVVGVIVVSRMMALGLYWAVLETLIPLIPGAMCMWGVLQAGSPYSWIDTVMKPLVLYVYGAWLVLDSINRRVSSAPLTGTLSRGFLFLLPFLLVDAGTDLAFFAQLVPVSVPCCTVFFTPESLIPCPFCFVFHEAPFMMGAVAGYGLSLAFMVWAVLVRRYTRNEGELGTIGKGTVEGMARLSLASAVMATGFLITALLQILSAQGFYH